MSDQCDTVARRRQVCYLHDVVHPRTGSEPIRQIAAAVLLREITRVVRGMRVPTQEFACRHSLRGDK